MQVQWFGYHEVVTTLKPYLMEKNFFEMFVLTGAGGCKRSCPRAIWWNFHYLIFISTYLFTYKIQFHCKNHPSITAVFLSNVSGLTKQVLLYTSLSIYNANAFEAKLPYQSSCVITCKQMINCDVAVINLRELMKCV